MSDATRVSAPIWLMALAAFTVGCGMRVLGPLMPMMARDFGGSLAAVAPLPWMLGAMTATGLLAWHDRAEVLKPVRPAACC